MQGLWLKILLIKFKDSHNHVSWHPGGGEGEVTVWAISVESELSDSFMKFVPKGSFAWEILQALFLTHKNLSQYSWDKQIGPISLTRLQPCQNVPAAGNFPAFSQFLPAYSTWDFTRSLLEVKGTWCLFPTTPSSPSQGYPPALWSPVPIYTPGWREKMWNKVSCLRKQHNGSDQARTTDL